MVWAVSAEIFLADLYARIEAVRSMMSQLRRLHYERKIIIPTHMVYKQEWGNILYEFVTY